MKLLVNTTFDRQETPVESKDRAQALRSHLRTHPRAGAVTGPDSATRGRRAGAVNHSLAHFEKETVTTFWSKCSKTTF